jgi:hypothetical protein
VSTDKEFGPKAAEVVGLYLNPPLNAVVLSVDCLASITFPGQRQLFLPIGDNYNLYESAMPFYTEPDRSRG